MQRGSSLAFLKSDFYNDFWPRIGIFGAMANGFCAAQLRITVDAGSCAAWDDRTSVDFIILPSRNDYRPFSLLLEVASYGASLFRGRRRLVDSLPAKSRRTISYLERSITIKFSPSITHS